jgi:transcriptional regulator with GAF, ATPase, and Fis domain
MNGITNFESKEIRLLNNAGATSATDKAVSNNKTRVLKQLALSLLMEVQSLGEVHALDIKSGIDFYDEVRRFEIDLIKRALAFTGGHQVRAARLLNMKVTTLNSKIKHYDISMDVIVGDQALQEGTSENPIRKQA